MQKTGETLFVPIVGWDFLERLAKQNVMQVQSAADPPKKIALGERSIMMDGREDLANLLKDQGAPVEIIYPAEGSPMVIGPSGVFV